MSLSTDSAIAIAAPRDIMMCSSQVWPKECAQGRNDTETSVFSIGRIELTAFKLEQMLPCESKTPLGLPVVPEV